MFYILLLLIIAVVAPTLIFMYVYSYDEVDDSHTCNILQEYRIPCGPAEATPKICTDINCCYNEKTNKCYHTLPSKYQFKSNDENWKNGFVPILQNSPFNVQNTKKIYLSYENDTNNIKFTLNNKPFVNRNIHVDTEKYYVNITTTEMGIEIRRNDKNNDIILTTTNGPTIISENYWEWTLNLNTENLYGLDQFFFKKNTTITRVIYPNDKNHGIIPKFMAEINGLFHGVYIEHSGPLEITVLPSKLIILRMLSEEKITVHLHLGPKPSDIWRTKGKLQIPYWALGVHICR